MKQPATGTLLRLILSQRQEVRQDVYEQIAGWLSPELLDKLDTFLVVTGGQVSPLQSLKQTPGQPSPAAMLRLISKLGQMESVGILTVDLSCLNNNYQRSIAHYAKRCSATKLRDLEPARLSR